MIYVFAACMMAIFIGHSLANRHWKWAATFLVLCVVNAALAFS